MNPKSTFQKVLLNLIITSFFTVFTLFSVATNPEISKNLVNLSANIAQTVNDDNLPEMIIEENTIHALWINRKSGSDATLYYCRSTDMGETWKTPQQIWQYIDPTNKGNEYTSQRLAVSGENVYIGICDYDYNNNGTGYIYLVKSANGGESFGEAEQLTDSGGGYSRLSNCFIRSSGNKVAIVYRDANYNNAFEGLNCLYSGNNGNTFNKTTVSEEYINNVSDFLFDGTQLIVVHEYSYYSYGLSKGQVYVSVSNDNGASFTTNKVSLTHGESEKNRSMQDQHYVPKVVKDGNNIHLIFLGNNAEAVWSVLYTRSTNGGNSFEEARNFGTEILAAGGKGSWFQTGQETITAKGGYVYLTYLRGDGKCYYQYSSDNGATFSEPEDILTENTKFIQYTWWPQLVIDPSDETGKTVYFGSGAMMTRKSIDGGKSFHNTTYLFPIFDAPDIGESVLRIGKEGNIHWLSQGRFHRNYDFDIFYAHKMPEPEPGSTNKSYSLKTTYNDIQETSIVPSSASIEFDSAMTAEAWIRVKYDESGKISFFTKVNGNDSYITAPSAYNIGLNQYYGRETLHLCAGIETDKGDFVIEPDYNIHPIPDSLWHHIAFTYDANAGLNNFKAYMDGLLIGEKTVTGEILQGDGLFIIGSSAVNGNSKYEIDDIRLWNRALTQKELIENQTKEFTGEEDGLKLFLNFDDTFKDISGNGNDAVPLYLGELKTSNFDPPITDFEMYQVTNEISFNNKTTNATSWLWDFGNENTSEQGNPKYTYPTSGEYSISLLAKNANSVTAAIKNATIVGLDRVEPEQAGNYGYTTINVFGGGLSTENTIMILRKEGEDDLVREEVYSEAEGSISAIFNLQGIALGKWDVIVSKNGTEMSLPGAFTIIEGVAPDPWVNITGRGQILFNMWQTYTINYGNNGNVDAFGVPLWIALTDFPELEIEFVDFIIDEPASNIDDGITGIKDSIPLYFVADEYFSTDEKARVYPLYIPKIPANSSTSIHIRIKSPASLNVETWVSDPFFTGDTENEKAAFLIEDVPFSEMNAGARACIGLSMTKVFTEGLVGLAGLALPIGCINALVTAKWNPWDYKPKGHKNDVPTLGSTAWQMTSVIVGCAGDLPYFKAFKITVAVAQLAAGMYDAYQADKACREAWLKKSGNKKGIGAVSSFDPNEMIGPAGYGENNYIQKNNIIPYTILYENKNTATAPAHIVTVTDTLDLSKFNLSDFGFGSFGWGDTIIAPAGNKLKEFSEDIDMRPQLNLITRVSGKLDTISGIVNWEFLSLNPETMNLEEDPFIGFLPPNNTSPEGEGFVSFSVGLKEELVTNSEIRNKATIVFDANEPIITNEFVNILDLDKPESRVYQLEPTIDANFPVAWTGSDVGSGIGGYDIYVMVNDTLLQQWLYNIEEVTAEYNGEIGSTYKFYSIAKDNVNLWEAEPGEYDASTTVTVDIDGFELVKEELTVFPNPASDNLKITLTNAPCGMYVVELIGINGSISHSQIYDDFELQNGVNINITNYNPGQYVLRMVYGDKIVSKKIMVK